MIKLLDDSYWIDIRLDYKYKCFDHQNVGNGLISDIKKLLFSIYSKDMGIVEDNAVHYQ